MIYSAVIFDETIRSSIIEPGSGEIYGIMMIIIYMFGEINPQKGTLIRMAYQTVVHIRANRK
jgi:hypothetical protein